MKKVLVVAVFSFLAIVLFASSQNRTALAEAAQTSKIRVIYFQSPDCSKCKKIKPFIEEIKKEYGDRIDFLEHNVKEKEECRQLFFHFASAYNVPEEKAGTPLVFVGKDYLAGPEDIEKNLRSKIEQKIKINENLLFDCHKFLENWPNVDKIDFIEGSGGGNEVCGIEKNFCSADIESTSSSARKQASLLVIIAAAFFDSINPCAIAVLIFLISILTSLKSSRKRIILTGLVYIFAVFISYYLAGLGLIGFITYSGYANEIKFAAGIIVVLLGILTIKEGIYAKEKQLLIIPPKTKEIFIGLMKKGALISVFLAGIVVSAVELPCTGAVYLTILSMLSQEGLKTQGYAYLFIYNFIFVLPLIIILFIGAWGFNTEHMEKIRKRNRMSVKILMGIAMILLGGFMVYF